MLSPSQLSFWLSLAGFAPGPAGAWAWVICGMGWLGVAWERSTACDLRNIRSAREKLPTLNGFATHLPQLALGIYRLRRHYAR